MNAAVAPEMSVGAYLRSVRERYGASTRDFERITGLGSGTFLAIENERPDPALMRIKTVVKLAEAYGLDPEELAGMLVRQTVARQMPPAERKEQRA